MEAQNNKPIAWRPTRLMQNLEADPDKTLTQMAKLTPSQVERKFEAYRYVNDQLDNLKRSEQFFLNEYTGQDREYHLIQVRNMIEQTEFLLEASSAPRTIGQLNRENSESTAWALALLVNDLRKYFILDRMITTSGIISLLPIIVTTYPGLTLEEVAVCFAQAKKGMYGEDYQRLDGSTIMKWLKLYVEDRQERLLLKRYANEVQYKAGAEKGRTERGESLAVFLKKATGASIIYKEIKNKK